MLLPLDRIISRRARRGILTVATDTEGSPNWIGWIMMALLALLGLACIVSGGIFYVWIFADWLQGSGGFTGLQVIGWIVGLIAAAVIGVGLALAGLFLRFLSWAHAPLASLVLSIVSTGFILMTYLVYSDTGHETDSIEIVLL